MTPTTSKGSSGRVGQAKQALEGMTRTNLSCAESRYEIEVPTGHPVVHWANRRAAWLLERFQPGEDGLESSEGDLPFAEIVLGRDPGPHILKCRSKWG